MSKSRTPQPPEHLKPATRAWWLCVCGEFELEPHHVRLLTLASEAWDRATDARLAIEQHGMTFEDRFGAPHARPEVAIERDSRLAFARLLRELALDVDAPAAAAARPPATAPATLKLGGR